MKALLYERFTGTLAVRDVADPSPVDRIGQSAELLRHGASVVVKDLAELRDRP
jgi:hypothetical protein